MNATRSSLTLCTGGYVIAPEAIVEALRKRGAGDAEGLGRLNLAAASAALDDIAHVEHVRSKRGVVAGLLIVPVCGCVHDFGCGHNLYEWIG